MDYQNVVVHAIIDCQKLSCDYILLSTGARTVFQSIETQRHNLQIKPEYELNDGSSYLGPASNSLT